MAEANKKGIHHLGKIARTYERILELPVPVVLKILWLAGAASVGLQEALRERQTHREVGTQS